MGELNQKSINRAGVAAGLLLFISFLFTFKYGHRAVGDYSSLLALAWLTAQIAGAWLIYRLPVRGQGLKYVCTGVTLAAFGGMALLAHRYIALQGLNVDRWSVISSYLDALAGGQYPYSAKSHMGNPPGPMPSYFIIAYPFYTLQVLEVLSAIGPIALGLMLIRRFDEWRWARAFWVLLLSAPFLYWEIAVRSNILTFSTIVLAVLVQLTQAMENRQRTNYLLYAALSGVTLATRSVFAIAYIIVFGQFLFYRSTRWLTLILGGISLLAFALTFIPLQTTWPEEFAQMNPFIVQSDFLLPVWMVLGFLTMTAGSLLIPAVRKRPFFSSGVLLFAIIALYAGYHLMKSGLVEAYLGSRIDISYFIFCVPFLVYGGMSKTGPPFPSIERNAVAQR